MDKVNNSILELCDTIYNIDTDSDKQSMIRELEDQFDYFLKYHLTWIKNNDPNYKLKAELAQVAIKLEIDVDWRDETTVIFSSYYCYPYNFKELVTFRLTNDSKLRLDYHDLYDTRSYCSRSKYPGKFFSDKFTVEQVLEYLQNKLGKDK